MSCHKMCNILLRHLGKNVNRSLSNTLSVHCGMTVWVKLSVHYGMTGAYALYPVYVMPQNAKHFVKASRKECKQIPKQYTFSALRDDSVSETFSALRDDSVSTHF